MSNSFGSLHIRKKWGKSRVLAKNRVFRGKTGFYLPLPVKTEVYSQTREISRVWRYRVYIYIYIIHIYIYILYYIHIFIHTHIMHAIYSVFMRFFLQTAKNNPLPAALRASLACLRWRTGWTCSSCWWRCRTAPWKCLDVGQNGRPMWDHKC